MHFHCSYDVQNSMHYIKTQTCLYYSNTQMHLNHYMHIYDNYNTYKLINCFKTILAFSLPPDFENTKD